MKIPPALVSYAQTQISRCLSNDEGDSFYLLSASLGTRTLLQGSQFPKKRDTYWKFRPKKKRSRIAWVQDGVVIQEDPISLESSWISVLLVIHADGLETDLTGFSLIRSESLEERCQRACVSVSRLLKEAITPRFDEIMAKLFRVAMSSEGWVLLSSAA